MNKMSKIIIFDYFLMRLGSFLEPARYLVISCSYLSMKLSIISILKMLILKDEEPSISVYIFLKRYSITSLVFVILLQYYIGMSI